MLSQLPAFYPHRRNSDGSFDSICLNCFATVANAGTEPELLEYDSRHVCEPATVSQRAFDRRVLEGKAEAAKRPQDPYSYSSVDGGNGAAKALPF